MHRVQAARCHPLAHRHPRRQQNQLTEDPKRTHRGDAWHRGQQLVTLPQLHLSLHQIESLAAHSLHTPLNRSQGPPQVGQHRPRSRRRALRAAQTVLQPSLLHHQRLDITAHRSQPEMAGRGPLPAAERHPLAVLGQDHCVGGIGLRAAKRLRKTVHQLRVQHRQFHRPSRIQRQRQIQRVNAGGLQRNSHPGVAPRQPG